jgi:nicotinamide-nucleotide amidase
MTAQELLIKARERGLVIATAESCTGGLISAAITGIAGSSAVFDRGFVTYTNAAKIAMLGVQETTLEAHGAVSEQVAAEMAKGAVAQSDADIAISITGIAGPGGSDHKPEGRVCFGLSYAGQTHTETTEFGAIGRQQVRAAASDHAMKLLGDAVISFTIK